MVFFLSEATLPTVGDVGYYVRTCCEYCILISTIMGSSETCSICVINGGTFLWQSKCNFISFITPIKSTVCFALRFFTVYRSPFLLLTIFSPTLSRFLCNHINWLGQIYVPTSLCHCEQLYIYIETYKPGYSRGQTIISVTLVTIIGVNQASEPCKMGAILKHFLTNLSLHCVLHCT